MEKTLKLVCTIVLSIICTSNLIAQSTEWYFGISVGTGWMDTVKQAGFNNDRVCYPTFVCPQEPRGYRWYYDLDTSTRYGIELSIGKSIRKYRLETAFTLASNDTLQIYDRITFLDGSPLLLNENSEYSSVVESTIGGISFTGLMVNSYRDFQFANNLPLTSYIGIGVGVARAEIEELLFRSDYACISDQCDGPPASNFNVLQKTDLVDWVWAINVMVGIDYQINSRMSVGLKIAHRVRDDLVQSASYQRHPFPDAMNTTTFSELSSWSMSLNLTFKR